MNQPTRNILYVFLASPGGLEVERQLARDVVEEVNRTFADTAGWQIELLGWEDTTPGFGRPQALINRDVDRCQVFVGLLHKRWGQPTGSGTYTSGFEEEFDRAVQRRRGTGAPDMILVLKRIEDRTDPGEQMQRVLQFRDAQIENKELLFKEISDASEWERNLRGWLSRAILDRLVPPAEDGLSASAPQSTASTAEDAEALRDVAGAVPEAETVPLQLSNAGTRIAQLARRGDLSSFGEFIDKVEEFDLLRLLLATKAAVARRFDPEVLGVHEINRLYLHREALETTFLEDGLLVRTLVTDSHNVVPGWYWLVEAGLEDPAQLLLYIGLRDRDDEIRRGALQILADAGALPKLHRRKGARVRKALVAALVGEKAPLVVGPALALLRRISTPADLPTIEATLGSGGASNTADLDNLKLALRAVLDADAVFSNLLNQRLIPTASVAALWPHQTAIGESLLHQGLTHTDVDIRRLSAATLFGRRALSEQEANRLTEDPQRTLRVIGNIALTHLGVQREPAMIESETKEASPSYSTGGDQVVTTIRSAVPEISDFINESEAIVFENLRLRDPSELLSSIEWYGQGTLSYRALAIDHFDLVQDRLRHDLETGFEDIWRSYAEDTAARFGAVAEDILKRDRDILEFVRLKFASAALAGLAMHGNPSDAKFGRQYVGASYEFVRRPASRVLRRFGDQDDALRLLRLARNAYGDLKDELAEAAIALSQTSDSAQLLAMMGSDDPVLVRLAVRWMYENRSDTAAAAVRPLLRQEKSEIREIAVAFYALTATPEELRALLDTYPQEQPSYFYNVMAWLDRLTFAPEPFQTEFRNRARGLLYK